MPKTPKLRAEHGIAVDIRAARSAARAERQATRSDTFKRIKDVAADPDGEHLWLLLEPKRA